MATILSGVVEEDEARELLEEFALLEILPVIFIDVAELLVAALLESLLVLLFLLHDCIKNNWEATKTKINVEIFFIFSSSSSD
ncbi:MAG: hypothetical protein H8E38_07025 [SAR324 cluster bacterium]|nr:hypothetical protein [SAR324 cluster bacterium]